MFGNCGKINRRIKNRDNKTDETQNKYVLYRTLCKLLKNMFMIEKIYTGSVKKKVAFKMWPVNNSDKNE